MSRPQILLVAPQTNLLTTVSAWLRAAGYELVVASTFADAKTRLADHPDLLVTAVKLGEYNGLHLALRAAGDDIPAVVIGPTDKVLSRDAHDLGATYLSSTLRRNQFLHHVEEIFAARHVPAMFGIAPHATTSFPAVAAPLLRG